MNNINLNYKLLEKNICNIDFLFHTFYEHQYLHSYMQNGIIYQYKNIEKTCKFVYNRTSDYDTKF